jgi:HSP20 family protein
MARSLIPSFFGGSPTRQSADPFLSLQREMNRLFDDVFRGFGASPAALGSDVSAPLVNISETDKELKVEAELPGVSEDDVEVTLSDDVLTIRGEKKAERTEQKENYHVMERSYGSFARSIRLPFPTNPDDVNASFNNGVLTLTIPKAAAQETSHRIPIGKGQAKQQTIGQPSGQQTAQPGPSGPESQTTH